MDELEKKELEKKLEQLEIDAIWMEEYKNFMEQAVTRVPPGTVITIPEVPFIKVGSPTKKRGRPKGSKSKPKIVTAKVVHENWEFTFTVPVSILMETPVNVLENLRDEKDLSRKLRILATILEGKV